jgi:predicted porin
MKKLLIAAAAMAVVAGAQAQSSVSVYGILDINTTSAKNDNANRDSALGQNSLSTSRLGFRGTEDLGGGLKAEFQLEAEMKPTLGQVGTSAASTSNGVTDSLFNRESWVGLSSAQLGSIRLGTTDVTDAANIDTTVSQMGELAKASELGTDKINVIRYTTPTYNGFSAQVGYATPGNTAAGTSELTASSVQAYMVKYEQGKLGLYAGMESKKIDSAYSQDQTMLGAKYDFGAFAVGAFYSTRDGATQDTSNSAELKQTRLSVSAPVAALGKGVTAHVAYLKDETTTTAAADYSGLKLALTKAFSPRTTGYIAYVSTDKELASEADSSSYSVGVRHSF